VLLGARWTPIVPALKILSIAAPLRYLLNMQSSWLDAIGELAIRTKVVACSFALKAIAMLYALEHNFTLESMLIAIILPDLLWQLTYIFVLDRRTSLKFTEFSRLIIAFALNGVTTAFFMTALTYALRTSGCGAATILILQSIASVVLLLGSMLLAMRYGRHGLERHHFQKIPYIGRII
jgi:O-antigen/teichoic acid export membrane protein